MVQEEMGKSRDGKNFWNSTDGMMSDGMIAQYADAYSVDIGASSTLYAGGTAQLSALLITRGKDAGIYIVQTSIGDSYGKQTKWGFEFGAGPSVTGYFYKGNKQEVNLSDLLGSCTVFSCGMFLKGSVSLSHDKNNKLKWIGVSTSAPMFGGSFGYGETTLKYSYPFNK